MKLINKSKFNNDFSNDIYYHFDNIATVNDIKKIFNVMMQSNYKFLSFTLDFGLDNHTGFNDEVSYTDYSLFCNEINKYPFEDIEKVSFGCMVNSEIIGGAILLEQNVLRISSYIKKNETEQSFKR